MSVLGMKVHNVEALIHDLPKESYVEGMRIKLFEKFQGMSKFQKRSFEN